MKGCINSKRSIYLKRYIKSDIDVILKDRPFWNSPKNIVECHLNLKCYKNLHTFISPWNLTTTQKLNFDIDSESWNNLICFIDSKLYLNADIQLLGSDFLRPVRWSDLFVAYCEVHRSNPNFFLFFIKAIACVQQSLLWPIC